MITDEMVEKALEAAEDAYPESKRSDMRAALEAVAPLLIAGYQQSLNKLGDAYDKKCEELAACNGALKNAGAAYALLLADRDKLIAQGLRGLIRAQKIDPK
jgi:hypothetical protein